MNFSRTILGAGALAAAVAAACSESGNDQGERSNRRLAEATFVHLEATSCPVALTLKGVDVSHYDGAIAWTTVKSSGISFAFVKATESTDYIDPDFATNWPAMKAAGVVRGAYHFFDSSVDPTSQANYCLATVGTLAAGDLPIVLDFEDLNGESEATAVANAVTFLAAVTKSTGKTAILYMSSDFLAGTYPALSPYRLWVANYGVTCPGLPAEWPAWSFWQSSDTGTVSGISGSVDLDTFNGTLAALGGLTGGTSGGSSSGSSGGGSSSGSSSSGSSSGSSGGGSSSGSSGGGSSSGSSGGGSSSGSSGGGSSSNGAGGSGGGGETAPSEDAGGASVTLDGSAPPATNGNAPEVTAAATSGNGGCASAPGRPEQAPLGALVLLGALGLVRARKREPRR